MGIICRLAGHVPVGVGKLIEGECHCVRSCKRCNEPVFDVAHRNTVDVFLDPEQPCQVTRKCTAEWCNAVLWKHESHVWTDWELSDATSNMFTHRCSRGGHVETEHRHQWVVDRVEDVPSYDPYQETVEVTRYEYRHCKSCHDVVTVER